MQATHWGQLVIGPPGSGKTTYCRALAEFLGASGRRAVVVNLDPANDGLPYEAGVNVWDLISLADVAEAYALGPNGGLMYCLEYLEANLDWLLGRLAAFPGAYFIFDCPGQAELYTHHASFANIVARLSKADLRLAVVHLVDASHITDASKFVSLCLLSLQSMIRLELPHVSALSKVDLVVGTTEAPATGSDDDEDEEEDEEGGAGRGPRRRLARRGHAFRARDMLYDLDFYTGELDVRRVAALVRDPTQAMGGDAVVGAEEGEEEEEEDEDDEGGSYGGGYGYSAPPDNPYIPVRGSGPRLFKGGVLVGSHALPPPPSSAGGAATGADAERPPAVDASVPLETHWERRRGFVARYRRLNAAIADLIEDFNLLSFVAVSVADATRLAALVKLVDKAHGYVPTAVAAQGAAARMTR